MLSSLAAVVAFSPSVERAGTLDERVHAAGDGLCDPNAKQLSGYFKLHEKPDRNCTPLRTPAPAIADGSAARGRLLLVL